MKICAISDTHGFHRQVKLPEGDVLVHCGDWTMNGEYKTYLDAYNWICEQSKTYKYTVCIMGNHDKNHEQFASMLKSAGIIYLEGTSITIEGHKIFGLPNVSNLYRWAFNDDKDPTCWERIPEDTEILISHSPPKDILDESMHYGSVGLKAKVQDLINRNLKVNIFGHCHQDGNKQLEINNKDGRPVLFVNCSICDINYDPTNSPMVIEI